MCIGKLPTNKMSEYRIAFLVSGRGMLARMAVEHAQDLGFGVEGLVLGTAASTELPRFAEKFSVPIEKLLSKKVSKSAEELARSRLLKDADLIVMTYDKIIPPWLVDHFAGKLINVHPSLLPAFPGLNAVSQAVNAGARFIGASMHFVTAEVDDGPLIAQCCQPLMPGSEVDAGRSLFSPMARMYLQVLSWFAAGRVRMSDGRVSIESASFEDAAFSPGIDSDFVEGFDVEGWLETALSVAGS